VLAGEAVVVEVAGWVGAGEVTASAGSARSTVSDHAVTVTAATVPRLTRAPTAMTARVWGCRMMGGSGGPPGGRRGKRLRM
jgi:hypothetical protein